MKLYLIGQDENNGYDTYDSAVVAAENEQQARLIHPGNHEWDGSDEQPLGSWVPANRVAVDLIGEAIPGTRAGVICASFNAG